MITPTSTILTAPNIATGSHRLGRSFFTAAIESNRKYPPSYRDHVLSRFYAAVVQAAELHDAVNAPEQFARTAEQLISTPEYRQILAVVYSGVAVAGTRVSICQAGDLRVHLLSADSTLKCRTRDHNLVEDSSDASSLPHLAAASIWTRALQLNSDANLESYSWDIEPGDRLLICSSGFHEYREPEEYIREFSRADVDIGLAAAGREGYLCLLAN
jgi:serine/threonine protein phosphatase PrpC